MPLRWHLINLLALISLRIIPITSLALPPPPAPTSSPVSLQPLNETINGSYSITQKSEDPALRATAIKFKRTTFLYGPPVAGGPYFPDGPLGSAKVSEDQADIQLELVPELTLSAIDSAKASADVEQYDGLQTLEDYTKLYNNEWKNTLPSGPDPGVLTNYTQDLLFSMERLSTSPYQVRRLDPSADRLAFQVNNKAAMTVAGMTLHELFRKNRLFYADYRDQKNLTPTTRYSGACDAYFYIDKKSGDFLPLAIRTNVGAEVVYTPADSADDWLLAKIMYNVDDFWFAQWNHLAGTHEVVQIIWMAAIRTLSVDHPILALLNRLMYQVFAIQPLAQTILFMPGSGVDQVFAYTGQSAEEYSNRLYQSGGSGRFQANYFANNLEDRGLINCKKGPALKRFPFYEDGFTIYDAIHKFMTAFVQSYYKTPTSLERDSELQAWAKECNGPAKAIDFPPSICSFEVLVDILAHMAHLASTAHHAVNTNELLHVSSTLPFHPPSLYSPVPTTKGHSKPIDFLPPFPKVLEQFSVAALFARPLLVGTNRTLLHMFDDPAMLSRMNAQTCTAAAKFKSDMQAFSAQVSTRNFDAQGLSQGMPFVWKALDPNVQPYSITT